MNKQPETWAREAAGCIVLDISDRRGLKWEWNRVDIAVRADIRKEWARLIQMAHDAASSAMSLSALYEALGAYPDKKCEELETRLTEVVAERGDSDSARQHLQRENNKLIEQLDNVARQRDEARDMSLALVGLANWYMIKPVRTEPFDKVQEIRYDEWMKSKPNMPGGWVKTINKWKKESKK